MKFYNPYPQIDLEFGKDNKLFHELFEAVMKVSPRFVSYKYEFETNPSKTDIFNHVERVFAYELYRQWFNIIEKNNDDLILNAELDKGINEEYFIVEDKNNESKTINKYPDLILHSSQGNDKEQKIICEIKRKDGLTPALILADLCKIGCYMNEKYFISERKTFEYGVFILIGERLSKISEVKKKCKVKFFSDKSVNFGNFKKEFGTFFHRIVCISYDGIILEYDTLDNLV